MGLNRIPKITDLLSEEQIQEREELKEKIFNEFVEYITKEDTINHLKNGKRICFGVFEDYIAYDLINDLRQNGFIAERIEPDETFPIRGIEISI